MRRTKYLETLLSSTVVRIFSVFYQTVIERQCWIDAVLKN